MVDNDGAGADQTDVVVIIEPGELPDDRFKRIAELDDYFEEKTHHPVEVRISFTSAASHIRSFRPFGNYNVPDASKMKNFIGAENGRIPQPGDQLHFRFASKDEAVLFKLTFG